MTFDYTGLRTAVVDPLLIEFGTSGALLIPGAPSGPAYDPQPGADVSAPVTIVQTQFTKEDRAGGNVEKDDSAFLVSTKDVTVDPSLAHRISVASVTYQVIGIKPLRPAAIVMLWKVHARK